MTSIRRCSALIGLVAAGMFVAGAASAQQSFVAPAPDGYPPGWNRSAQDRPVTATFMPGSDAYHWASASPPPATASAIVYQMQPGSAHYHHVQ